MSTPSSLSEAKQFSVRGRFAFPFTGRAPRRWLWLGWLVLVFGILNIYGRPIESFQTRSGPPSVSIDGLSERTSFLDKILIDLRDDSDARYYYSVAQAALGRPYQLRHVQPYDDALQGTAAGADVGETIAPPRPLLPWRDFLLEYPPGMLAVILAPSFVTSDRDTYFTIFNLEMEFLLTLAVYFSVRTADLLRADGTRVLFQAILLTAALGEVAVRRYDPSVALAISAAIYALATKRPGASGAALAFGVALKGVPLLLAPMIALWFVSRRDWHGLRAALYGFGIVMGVATTGYLAIAWPRVFNSFAYHVDRPIQMESIYSAFLMMLRVFWPHILSIEHSYGSYNIVSPYEPILRSLRQHRGHCGHRRCLRLGLQAHRRGARRPRALRFPDFCELCLSHRFHQSGEGVQHTISRLAHPSRRARRRAVRGRRTMAPRHSLRPGPGRLPFPVYDHRRRPTGGNRWADHPRSGFCALALAVQNRKRPESLLARQRQRDCAAPASRASHRAGSMSLGSHCRAFRRPWP